MKPTVPRENPAAASKTAPEGAVGPDRSGGVRAQSTRVSAGPPARTTVLIDGFNLYHGLRERFGRRYLWLDLVRMARLLRPRDDIVTVRYFTAMIENDAEGRQRQETYHAALSAHCGPALEIVLGRFQVKVRTCRSCGASWRTFEEKETDVNIAVAVMTASATPSNDLLVIVSADSDLCPALRAARQIAPRLGLIAAFPPRRSSFEIKSLVPGNFMIGHDKIRRAQLPDVVRDEAGRILRRPEHWK